MTDHADTIRRNDAETIKYALHRARAKSAHTFDSGPCQGPDLCLACANQAALGATDRLVAERQQAIDERDAWKESTMAELAEKEKLRAQLQQAIDALRELRNESSARARHRIIDAALLSLGEQP